MLKTNVYNVICNWSTRMRLPLINSNASDTMCALTLARLCIPFHVFVSSSFASTSVSILSAFFESYLFGWAHNIRCICAASIHPDEEISCGRRATTIKFKPNKTLIFFFSPEQIKPNQDAMCRDSDFFFQDDSEEWVWSLYCWSVHSLSPVWINCTTMNTVKSGNENWSSVCFGAR